MNPPIPFWTNRPDALEQTGSFIVLDGIEYIVLERLKKAVKLEELAF